MMRTRLAMPARPCSAGGDAATAAWVVAATSATAAVEDGDDELVFVGEALVEIACGQAGPAADRPHGEVGFGAVTAQQVKAGVQEPASALREAVGRPDTAVRADLCHVGHRATLTAVSGVGQYLTTNVLTFGQVVNDDSARLAGR